MSKLLRQIRTDFCDWARTAPAAWAPPLTMLAVTAALYALALLRHGAPLDAIPRIMWQQLQNITP